MFHCFYLNNKEFFCRVALIYKVVFIQRWSLTRGLTVRYIVTMSFNLADPVVQKVPVPVVKTVERKIPVAVPKPVPYPVERKIPVPVHIPGILPFYYSFFFFFFFYFFFFLFFFNVNFCIFLYMVSLRLK